ncbi:MAG: metal-dependent hydrolase [Zetaproteobacteria bacterium]|nr:MAG: metal-dependent hydrolase [Zetaproteobacteria bacterium]
MQFIGNPLGLWTLFVRETRRFLNVKMQTIVAPALTALLYLLVFHYAMGARKVPGLDVDYFSFLAPGLAMMAMLQNAFANTSSSMITAKVMGVHVYLLMAPLSAAEIVIAFVAAACVRALIVALAFLAPLAPFVHWSASHLGLALLYGLIGSVLMGAWGLLAGIWARRFDDMAVVTNFVVMPLTFLSGVFYTTAQLPAWAAAVNRANPFFYLIDGFRFGLLGVADGAPFAAWAPLALLALASCAAAWHAWRIGWRIKA